MTEATSKKAKKSPKSPKSVVWNINRVPKDLLRSRMELMNRLDFDMFKPESLDSKALTERIRILQIPAFDPLEPAKKELAAMTTDLLALRKKTAIHKASFLHWRIIPITIGAISFKIRNGVSWRGSTRNPASR
jgi:hypothetical protein